MSALAAQPNERTAETTVGPARVWEAGEGEPLGFLAGMGGLPKWLPVLDKLAERRRVVAPSLPGFPGGAEPDYLDDHLDWLLATGDTLAGAGLAGADLIGASVGGALAADIAAVRPDLVRKLVLIAPFGLYDDNDPVADVFAQRPGTLPEALSTHPDDYKDYGALPEGENELEWQVMGIRANAAAARILWPLGNTRLAKRLSRITAPTLVIWGAEDRIIPPSYAKRFADAISGPVTVKTIKGAGHAVEFDAPDAVADAVIGFLEG